MIIVLIILINNFYDENEIIIFHLTHHFSFDSSFGICCILQHFSIFHQGFVRYGLCAVICRSIFVL